MDKFLRLFQIPETRSKIVNTLLLLLAYRVGFQIPIPGMDPAVIRERMEGAAGTAFGLLSAFSGGRVDAPVIFALGIMPYISASIIFSILGKVSPQIEAIQKEGASGQKKISQWTRLAAVPIAIIQGSFIYFGVFTQQDTAVEPGFGLMVVVVMALVAGALLVMWIGELITEHGIGNGASLIIMAGIISTMPSSLSDIISQQQDSWNLILTLVAMWFSIVIGIVFIQKGERRVPIQYARLTRGRRVYGGQRHYLPLKVNMAGVMPIIFASAMFIIPGAVFAALGWDFMATTFADTDGFIYVSVYLALIFFFTFFWNNLMYQPEEIAKNLRESGSFIPGIRPGARTATYLKEVLQRVTLAGAVFIAVIAVIPNFITGAIPALGSNLAFFLGGTSVLIVVGVALDVVDRLNAQLVQRNYDGFMKGNAAAGSATTGSWARKG